MDTEHYINKATATGFILGMVLTVLMLAGTAFAAQSVSEDAVHNVVVEQELFMQLVEQKKFDEEESFMEIEPAAGKISQDDYMDLEPASGMTVLEDDDKNIYVDLPEDVDFMMEEDQKSVK